MPEPVARLESGCPQIVLDVLGQIREGLRVFDEPERFVCLFAVVGEAPKLSGPAVQGEGGIRGLAGALGALEIPDETLRFVGARWHVVDPLEGTMGLGCFFDVDICFLKGPGL